MKRGVCLLLLALLAPSAARSRCTAVVCSCYAPSRRTFNNKGGEGSTPIAQNRDELQDGNGNGCNGIPLEFPNLKSNLKKKTKEEGNCSSETRKVNWPDAHGKDIAHIQEFEPSVSGDGELEGVRNSCVCTIQ